VQLEQRAAGPRASRMVGPPTSDREMAHGLHLVGLAGVAVIRGQAWGRFIGIALVGLSLVANVVFLPHYPLWAILIIAWDVAIIWALAVYREDAA
jgi:hypothetical protein